MAPKLQQRWDPYVGPADLPDPARAPGRRAGDPLRRARWPNCHRGAQKHGPISQPAAAASLSAS
jgi:hypothetical protein